MEEDFLERVLQRLEKAPSVPDPTADRPADLRPSTLRRWDRVRSLKELMVRHDIFDRSLLGRLPRNPALRVEAGSSGLFSGFRPRVALLGLCLTPQEPFVLAERSGRPLPYADLEGGLRGAVDPKLPWQFVAVFAATGFEAACRENLPSGRNYACLLVEKGRGTAWVTHGGDREEWSGAAELFALETAEEMLDRCVETLRGHPDLRLRGGHLAIDRAREELGFPADVFDRAVAALTGGSEEFLVRQFDGVRILQRSRF